MFEKDAIKTELREYLKSILIKRRIHINKIIIFGSFNSENFDKDKSDIDLILISEDFRNKNIFERVKITTGIGRELVKHFQIPFDIIYYSDEEWEKGESLIIDEAKKKGVVILE